MDTNNSYSTEFDCPAVYEIKVRGEIDPDCLYGLEEMNISHQTLDNGSVSTVLTGLLLDQTALNGVLNSIRLSQLTIVSVLKVGDCL